MKFETEFGFYLNHKDELVKEYAGKHLIIVSDQLQGSFETFEDALVFGSDKFGIGKFFIIQCEESDENINQTYYSRVLFREKAI